MIGKKRIEEFAGWGGRLPEVLFRSFRESYYIQNSEKSSPGRGKIIQNSNELKPDNRKKRYTTSINFILYDKVI